MKKIIQKSYVYMAVILLLVFVYQCLAFRNSIVSVRDYPQYGEWTVVDSSMKELTSPEGIEEVYWLTGKLDADSDELVFYTRHQNVKVYIGDECVYELKPGENNLFGKTTGYVWNSLPVYQEDLKKGIRVELFSTYKDVAGVTPDFYIGSQFHILRDSMLEKGISFVQSVLAVALGLIFVVYVFYSGKFAEKDYSLLWLGVFAVCVGVWQMTDCGLLSLLFPEMVAFSYMPFISLMLAPLPFTMFMREQKLIRESGIWWIPCIMNIVSVGLSVFFQVMNLYDFRETLWMTHVTLLVMMVIVPVTVIQEIRSGQWNSQMKRNITCLALCFIGLAADLVIFYISNGMSRMILGMMGFLAYITILGMNSVKETGELIAIGKRAQKYEQMAYHDQLTGLYNRTAYADHVQEMDLTVEKIIVVMFDLNDLKRCNDTLGHEVGDRYIMEGARLIRENFADVGNCYRMGGDEFCVLLKQITIEECKKRVKRLQQAVESFNSTEKVFVMQIACGYERYDQLLDYDLGDTLRRADKNMYREKYMMKQKNV